MGSGRGFSHVSRFGFWHGGNRPKVEYIGYLLQNNSGGSYSSKTWTGAILGDPASDREIIFAISHNSPGSQTITSVTIGGVAATLGSAAGGAAIGKSIGSAWAHVPTGATGDVTITFSGNISTVLIGVFRVTGRPVIGASHVDFDSTYAGSGASSATITDIDLPDAGFGVGCLAIYQDSASVPSLSGAPFIDDAVVNVQSVGAAIYHSITHCPVQEGAAPDETITWSWGSNEAMVAGVWVFA